MFSSTRDTIIKARKLIENDACVHPVKAVIKASNQLHADPQRAFKRLAKVMRPKLEKEHGLLVAHHEDAIVIATWLAYIDPKDQKRAMLEIFDHAV